MYGSDAVAGVLNFITRKNYEGFEGTYKRLSAPTGTARRAQVSSVGRIRGRRLAVMFSYNYSTRDALLAGERPFTAADHRDEGGGNFANFNCGPASVSPATGQPGAGLIFAYPYDGAGIVNNAANGFCDFSGVTDLVPEDDRHNLLLKIEKQMSDNLTLSTDLVYARQET